MNCNLSEESNNKFEKEELTVAKVELSLESILKEQMQDGSWEESELVLLIEEELKEEVEKLEGKLERKLLIVVVMLLYLNLRFIEQADELFLIVNKSKSFLYKYGVDFSKLLEEIGLEEFIG